MKQIALLLALAVLLCGCVKAKSIIAVNKKALKQYCRGVYLTQPAKVIFAAAV